MGVNVYEQSRAKMANISTLAIYVEKLNSVLSEDFVNRFLAAAQVDGGCFGTALLRHINTRVGIFASKN